MRPSFDDFDDLDFDDMESLRRKAKNREIAQSRASRRFRNKFPVEDNFEDDDFSVFDDDYYDDLWDSDS